jgi:hypothetical protein
MATSTISSSINPGITLTSAAYGDPLTIRYGVELFASGTIVNTGSINSVALHAGGAVTNQAGGHFSYFQVFGLKLEVLCERDWTPIRGGYITI